MAKESVLTAKEKESLEIEQFIFHIIIQDGLRPIYLDPIVLTDSQKDFFKRRLIDVAEGTQFNFLDTSTSGLFKDCQSLMDDPDANFIRASRSICASFHSLHNKNTNDGVFVTALVSVEEVKKLIFLLKIDNRKVYEYKVKGSSALLEEIKNTFVEDKKTIQKSALIDVTDAYKWDILATDRTAGANAGIRDYFKKFLTAVERETPAKLTESAVRFVNRWAIANKIDLDPSQEVASYKTRAINYLMNTNKFKTKDFIDMVINDEDLDRRKLLKQSLKSYLDETGLSGQSFIPNKNVLTKAKQKHIRRTAEGIKIEWEGDPKEANISIPAERNNEDGLYHITIKTSEVQILN